MAYFKTIDTVLVQQYFYNLGFKTQAIKMLRINYFGGKKTKVLYIPIVQWFFNQSWHVTLMSYKINYFKF